MLVKIISIMLHNTYTTDDLVERIGLIKKYYNKYLFTNDTDVTVRDVLLGECDPYTLKSIEEWDEKFKSSGVQPLVVYEALDVAQEDLMGIPSVTMYVPVSFSKSEVDKFGMWFRDNVQPNILLSLHIDPRATGGCVFIWNNKYYDFSIKYYIDKKHNDIVNMFNDYIHAK